jgi:hypothetical protein
MVLAVASVPPGPRNASRFTDYEASPQPHCPASDVDSPKFTFVSQPGERSVAACDDLRR